MTKFEKAVDRAIAAENRAVEATLCRKCAGTGTLYIPIGPAGAERTKHRREECDRCGGTGLR